MDLILDSLACRRAGRMVFDGVSFRLGAGPGAKPGAGSAAELRGPNGVGKSSLIRVLAGLVPLAGGDARLGNISLRAEPGAFQEQVAYAGHLDAVKPALTVAENLAIWAAILGAPPGRVTGALARFGLEPIAGRRAAECSAGQKRRLGLARLLLADRPLWLLDEPTASLDTDAARVVADLIAGHVATGGLALVATHVDLGLPGAEVLRLTPLTAGRAAASDPFLEGAW